MEKNLVIEIILLLTGLVMSGIGAILTSQFKKIVETLNVLTSSVQELNLKMAMVLATLEFHKQEIDYLKKGV